MVNEKSRVEYQRLLSDGKTEQRLLNHPGFKKMFDGLFCSDCNFSIFSSGSAIYISNFVEFPDHTDGNYKGTCEETRICFRLEQIDGKEYLIFEKNIALNYNYLEKESRLKASGDFFVHIYDQYGNECGYCYLHIYDVISQRLGEKPFDFVFESLDLKYNLKDLLKDREFNVNDIRYNPMFWYNRFKWDFSAARRTARSLITEEVRYNSSDKGPIYSYGVINSYEGKDRLFGNTHRLLYTDYSGNWRNTDGLLYTDDMVNITLSEYDVSQPNDKSGTIQR